MENYDFKAIDWDNFSTENKLTVFDKHTGIVTIYKSYKTDEGLNSWEIEQQIQIPSKLADILYAAFQSKIHPD